MRLPALTVGQRQTEDARALHEAVWAASQAAQRHLVPCPLAEVVDAQQRLSGLYKGFWGRRGYKFHTRQTRHGVEVWVTPRSAGFDGRHRVRTHDAASAQSA